MKLRDFYRVFCSQLHLRIRYFISERLVLGTSNLTEFEALLPQFSFERFFFYKKLEHPQREAIYQIIKILDLKLEGKNVLDIGPGTGAFCDICAEHGASKVSFLELDPVFYIYNRLKGYEGVKRNHFFQMSRYKEASFDVIWSSGSFTIDILWSSKFGRWFFKRWLRNVVRCLKPGGIFIYKPVFQVGKNGEREIKDIEKSSYVKYLKDFGFKQLPKIEGHNWEPEYPHTFYWKKIINLSSGF